MTLNNPRPAVEPCAPITLAPVALSYRAREAMLADAGLSALAKALEPLLLVADSADRDPAPDVRPVLPRRHSPLQLPAPLRALVDAVLAGDGAAADPARPLLRVFEKTFAMPLSRLPRRVRDMACVAARAGEVSVKLLALACPEVPARYTMVAPWTEAGPAALVPPVCDPDTMPLPTPARIADTLLDLFASDAFAERKRVIALLRTPRYDLTRAQIRALGVRGGRIVAGSVELKVAGQDTPHDGAADNDWARIVRPYLVRAGIVAGALWPGDRTCRKSEFHDSHAALLGALPALGYVAGRGRNLQDAAAAALEEAGVGAAQMLRKGTRGNAVLALGQVANDGECLPARLTQAGRLLVRAWADLRLRASGGDAAAPLFTYRKLNETTGRIAAHWARAARRTAETGRAAPHSGLVRLPSAGELNAVIATLFADHAAPELARACARLHLHPYWMGSTAINALRIENGTIMKDGGPLQIAGSGRGGPADDRACIFEPHLNTLRDEHGRIGDGPFLRKRRKDASLATISNKLPSDSLCRLVQARPDLGFLKGGRSPADSLRALAAAWLVAAGVPAARLATSSQSLRLADVHDSGLIAGTGIDLCADALAVVLAWKQHQAQRGRRAQDLLFGLYGGAHALEVIAGNRDRLARAAARAKGSP